MSEYQPYACGKHECDVSYFVKNGIRWRKCVNVCQLSDEKRRTHCPKDPDNTKKLAPKLQARIDSGVCNNKGFGFEMWAEVARMIVG